VTGAKLLYGWMPFLMLNERWLRWINQGMDVTHYIYHNSPMTVLQ